MDDIKLIAFYLPQFHPVEENDLWWGKGFTEWTNVSSAKPVYPGHYQPHIPADLGFYDLRLAEVREEQARLAREHGIHGFCYYYYYFNGKRLLHTPLDLVLSTGKPDFPFCICWANENWTRNWDGRNDEILIEQVHTPESDLRFIRDLLPVIKDPRYIRVNNKLLVLVYRPELLPDPVQTTAMWRKFVADEMGEELLLCTVDNFVKDSDPTLLGFDAAVQFPLSVSGDCFMDKRLFAALHGADYETLKDNHFVNYPSAVNKYLSIEKRAYRYFRGVLTSWDNTPRRQTASSIFINATPEIYKLYLKAVIGLTRGEHAEGERLVFINAWNEWAEGAHLEPDKKHGRKYLEATRDALAGEADPVRLQEQITAIDLETRKVFTAARQLTEKVSAAETRAAQLTRELETQKLQSADELALLRKRMEETENRLMQQLEEKQQAIAAAASALARKEEQYREKENLVEQKENLIEQKENLIEQKEKTILEYQSRIREIEGVVREYTERNSASAERLNELETQMLHEARRLMEVRLEKEKLEAQVQARDQVIAGQRDAMREQEVQLRRLAQTVEEREALLLKKEQIITEKEALVTEKDRLIAVKDQLVAEKDSMIEARNQALQEKDAAIEGGIRAIEEVRSTLREKEAMLTRQLDTTQSYDRVLKEKEAVIASLNRDVRNARHLAAVRERLLQEKSKFINSLYHSFSWRITKPVRWLHAFVFRVLYLFFPYKSKRWRLLKSLFQPNWKEPSPMVQVSVPDHSDKKPVPVIISVSQAERDVITRINASRLFDRTWYLHTYPDVAKAGMDPVLHFIRHGYKLGNFPNPLFATRWYLKTYPDVSGSGVNPLVHYHTVGAKGGYNPNPLFDSAWYLRQYPDVARAGMNPLLHYLKHGIHERKNLIDTDPDVALNAPSLKKVAVLCHVYYPELWDQLSAALFSIPVEFDLFVSIPAKDSREIRRRILSDFPEAIIKPFQNIGGDIKPFLYFLEEIHARNIPVFCKIHTKKGKTHYGDIWRAVLLNAVLGSESLVRRILNAFEETPGLAMTGPALLYKSARSLEYRNKSKLEEMFSFLYPEKVVPEDWGFFAGTMFWGRTRTFAPLAKLVRQRFRFEKAELDVDGQLAHTIERMLGAVVRQEGLKIGLVTNELAIMHHRELEIHDADFPGSVENIGQTLLPLREMYFHAWKHITGDGEKSVPSVAEPDTGMGKIPFTVRLKFPFLIFRKGVAMPQRDVYEGQRELIPGKPNILLCAHNVSNHLAGGEVSFIDMARGLNQGGFNLFIVLPGHHENYVSAVAPFAVRMFILPYKSWGSASENNLVVLQIKRLIKQEKISAVYVNTIMVREPHKAARMEGIPSITHVRELLSGDETLTRIIGSTKEQIRDEVIRRTHFIVANSRATANFYTKANATFIVPNTIDTDEFDMENRVTPGRITVALISSNIPKKGIDEFVEVARICEKEITGATFLLIGPESEHYRNLREQSKGPGFPSNLRFMGYCSRPVEAVRMANIVMNLSLFTESFGRTVLEAMAARRPVVAYANGAIAELIEDGRNGYLVPFRDVALAAERIISLCREPEKITAMGEQGRDMAVKRYNVESYSRHLGKVMHEILDLWKRRRPSASAGPGISTPAASSRIPVSVVVPNYNYARYLEERLDSITRQTHPPAEIIFLDDASSDNSVEVARKILSKGTIPYRILANAKNEGTYRQWLRGFREAKGEYVWIAEADDACSELFLEKLVGAMESGGAVLGYTQSERIDGSGKQLAPHNRHHTDDLDPERWKHDYTAGGTREVTDYLFYRNSIPNVSACLFRKESLGDLPREIAELRYVGDWFLYTHLLRKGRIVYLAESLNRFRRHEESVTRIKGRTAGYLDELIRIKRYMIGNFPVRASQLEEMTRFLDRDYRIDGVKQNSTHPVVAGFLKEATEELSKRKRLVFITTNNGSYYGGSEQLWIEAAVKLSRANHDVTILIKNWNPAPPFFREFELCGIRILFKEQLDFSRVAALNPDLVVVSTGDQDEGTEYFGPCRQHNIPYIIINQLTKEPKYWPIRAEKTPAVKQGYLEARNAFFTCRNNHLVMEKRLGCKIPNALIHFNPFHLDRNTVIPYPSSENGFKLAIPANLLRIHKGQHIALEIFNMPKWRERPVHLNLYGRGADEEVLKKMAADLGLSTVTFHQRTPDLVSIWRENHAIFMPSFMEGLPIVLVGAMLCARVPIVTDIGGHREVIDDNRNGFIAAEPTVESVEEALERAYRQADRWEELGKKARESILRYLPAGDPVDDFIEKILPAEKVKNRKKHHGKRK